MSKAFKAWFKNQTHIPQGDYSYAEIAWDAAVKATKEKAAKVLGEISLTQDELQSIESACSTSTECYRVVAKALKDKHAAAIRSMK